MEADPEWQLECARAVFVIAEPLLPDRLPDWDEWVRRSWSVLVHPDDPWRNLKPRMIDEFPLNTPDDLIVLGLCASHQDALSAKLQSGALRKVQIAPNLVS